MDDDEQADREGYRIRSADTWTMARRDYLAGDAAEAVCARYDLKLDTLRSRAAIEARLNRLTQNATERALMARISDDSDELDSVFSPLSPA